MHVTVEVPEHVWQAAQAKARAKERDVCEIVTILLARWANVLPETPRPAVRSICGDCSWSWPGSGTTRCDWCGGERISTVPEIKPEPEVAWRTRWRCERCDWTWTLTTQDRPAKGCLDCGGPLVAEQAAP